MIIGTIMAVFVLVVAWHYTTCTLLYFLLVKSEKKLSFS